MTGLEATLYRQRLAKQGFAVRQFHYRSMTAIADAVLDELATLVRSLPPPVHLIGHSLGGLLVLKLARRDPTLPLGRLVLLGSPVNGSRSARAFAAIPAASLMFGDLASGELLAGPAPRWQAPPEVGVIAGTHSLGLGRFISHLPEPNDGAVALDETELEGATDRLVLRVSHTGLLVSRAVAAASVSFLRSGRFVPAP